MFARRLIPLVVAFAVAFAPAALEACQGSCLSRSVEAEGIASEHHHHSDSKPVSAIPAGHIHHHARATHASATLVSMAGQPHRCDDGDDLLAFSLALTDILVAPAIVPSTFHFREIDAPFTRVRDTAGQPSSGRIVLTAQLRV